MTRQVPVTSTVVDKRTECRMIPITEPGTEREIEVPQNLYRQGSLVIETCKIKYVQSDAGDFTSGKACGVAILSIIIQVFTSLPFPSVSGVLAMGCATQHRHPGFI